MAETGEPDTSALRAFNRSWSQRVGALEESFLGTGRSLGASRLLFDIGAGGAGVRDLRDRLGLDSGYLSRLLRGLEADGLIEVRPDPDDARRRVAAPTRRGLRELARLEERSEARARELLGRIEPAQRRRLSEALERADRILRSAAVVIEEVAVADPDAIAAVRRYFAELAARFPAGFDPGDAATADVAGMAPPQGAFLVARAGSVAACGGVQRHQGEIGEIKRMWVDPAWRGCGLGLRMLSALEDRAAALGYREVYLDTNATLTEAVALYGRAGYRSIERYNDNPYAERWFAKRL